MEELTLERAIEIIDELCEHHNQLVKLIEVRIEEQPLTEDEINSLNSICGGPEIKLNCYYSWCKIHGGIQTA